MQRISDQEQDKVQEQTTVQQPLLNKNVAYTLSQVSTATRFSLRCASLICEAFFETAKMSTSASLAIGRQVLVTALSSAGRMQVSGSSSSTSTTVKFSLKAAEETVHVLNGLFGSTETSRALAAIVEIVKREIYEDEAHEFDTDVGSASRQNERSQSRLFLFLPSLPSPLSLLRASRTKIMLLGNITKSITAYACLQNMTQRRKAAIMQLEPIFNSVVDYDRVCYGRPPFNPEDEHIANPLMFSKDFMNIDDNEEPEEKETAMPDEYWSSPVNEVEAQESLQTIEDMLNHMDAKTTSDKLLDSGNDSHINNPITAATAAENSNKLFPHMNQMEQQSILAERSMEMNNFIDNDNEEKVEKLTTNMRPIHTITTIRQLSRDSGLDDDNCLTVADISAATNTPSPSSFQLTNNLMPSKKSTEAGQHRHYSPQYYQTRLYQQNELPLQGSLRMHPNQLSYAQHYPSHKTQSPKSPVLQSLSPVVQPLMPFPRDYLANNIAHFLRYSTGAYGKRFMRIFGIGYSILSVHGDVHHPNHHAFAHHAQIHVRDIILSSHQPPPPTYLAAASSVSSRSSITANFFNPSISIKALNLESPRIHPLVHYLSVDHASKSIVLTLRGTLGLSDILTDLTCDYADVRVWVTEPLRKNSLNSDRISLTKVKQTFQAHGGMLKNAELLANQLGAYVKKALEDHPGYGLVLTGHSLGGGVAALLALLWSDRFNDEHDAVPSAATIDMDAMRDANTPVDEQSFLDAQVHRIAKSSNLPQGRPLHAFTFGSPCVVSYDLAVLCSSLVTSVVHGNDIVPCLSLGLVKDLKAMTKTLCDTRNRGIAEKIITRALGLGSSSTTQDDCTISSLEGKTMNSTISGNTFEDGSNSLPNNDPHVLRSSSAHYNENGCEEDWFWSLIQTLRAKMIAEKMYPVGTVYWLRAHTYVKRTQTIVANPSYSNDFHQPLAQKANLSSLTDKQSTPACDSNALISQSPVSAVSRARMLLPWPFGGTSSTNANAKTTATTTTSTLERRFMTVTLDRIEDVHELCGELRFSKSMFSDHNPRLYQDAMHGLELAVNTEDYNISI